MLVSGAEFFGDLLIKPKIVPRSQALIVSFFGSIIGAILIDTSSPNQTISLTTFVLVAIISLGHYLVCTAPESFSQGMNSATTQEFILPLMRQLWHLIKTQKDARKISIYLCLNLTFMFVELFYGIWNNSLGLISDAFHMLFDCVALFVGLVALVIAEWSPNQKFTYGFGRINVLSGFINGIFLVFISVSVFIESFHRFFEPKEVLMDKLLLVSVLGLLVNFVGLFAFHDVHDAAHGHSHSHGHSHAHGEPKKKHEELDEEAIIGEAKKKKKHGHSHEHGHGHAHGHEEECDGGHDDHDHGHGHSHGKKPKAPVAVEEGDMDGHMENMWGIYLHILGDTLGSVGVIVSTLMIYFFGWHIADPIFSLCISAILFASVIPLLKSSSRILAQSVPSKVERRLKPALNQVLSIDGVLSYREVHFWTLDGSEDHGSLHVQVRPGVDHQMIVNAIHGIFPKVKLTVQVDEELQSYSS